MGGPQRVQEGELATRAAVCLGAQVEGAKPCALDWRAGEPGVDPDPDRGAALLYCVPRGQGLGRQTHTPRVEDCAPVLPVGCQPASTVSPLEFRGPPLSRGGSEIPR